MTLAIAILFFGVLLRLYNLTAHYLWVDEAFSWLTAHLSPTEIWSLTDAHPPFFYLLLKGWFLIAGESLFSARLLGVIVSVAMLWGAYKLCQTMFSERVSLWVIFYLSVNSQLIFYSQQIRMYYLGITLVIWSWYFFMEGKWKWHFITTTLCVYTHYFTIFPLAFQVLYLKRGKFLGWLHSAGMGMVFYLPYLPRLTEQVGSKVAFHWKDITLLSFFSVFFFYIYQPDVSEPFWIVLTLALLFFYMATFFFVGMFYHWKLGLMVLFPPFLMWMISGHVQAFHPRFFLFQLPFFIILAVVGMDKMPYRKVWLTIGAMFFIVLLPFFFMSKPTILTDGFDSIMYLNVPIIHTSSFSYLPALIEMPDHQHFLWSEFAQAGEVVIPQDARITELPKDYAMIISEEDLVGWNWEEREFPSGTYEFNEKGLKILRPL
ncbi:MAG TPA: hypothetical protein ENI23_15755 [bacterium]|nr:hypothetical protein [bacterium]